MARQKPFRALTTLQIFLQLLVVFFQKNAYLCIKRKQQMKQKTLDYLESHQSETPSGWKGEAEWRRENKAWLRHSQHIAVKVLSFMKREQLTQNSMAQRLGCTQQYVSRILKGKENMSLETLTKLEQAMGIQIIAD